MSVIICGFSAILFILDIITIIQNARRGEESALGFWFLLWTSYVVLVIGLICFISYKVTSDIMVPIAIAILSFAVAFGIIFVNVIDKTYYRAIDTRIEETRNNKYIKKAKNRLEQLTDIE